MKKIKITDFVILTSVAIIVLFSFSCNKPKPCKAIITVKDSAGIALQQGISVKLFATVTTQTGTTTADLTAEGTTDAKGQVEFTFKLPAIMDIRAENQVVPLRYQVQTIQVNTSQEYIAKEEEL